MIYLGESLAGQHRFEEAEPLALEGHDLMASSSPPAIRRRDAVESIVRLYEAWNKPQQAAEWQARLAPTEHATP